MTIELKKIKEQERDLKFDFCLKIRSNFCSFRRLFENDKKDFGSGRLVMIRLAISKFTDSYYDELFGRLFKARTHSRLNGILKAIRIDVTSGTDHTSLNSAGSLLIYKL